MGGGSGTDDFMSTKAKAPPKPADPYAELAKDKALREQLARRGRASTMLRGFGAGTQTPQANTSGSLGRASSIMGD